MKKNAKEIIWNVARVGVAVVILGYLILSGKLDFSRLSEIGDRWTWLIAGALCFIPMTLVVILRWRSLLLGQHIHMSFWSVAKLSLIGFFFDTFMLGGTGGDLVKAYYVSKESHKKTEAITTVFLDRVVGMFSLALVSSVAILFSIRFVWGIPELRYIGIGVFSFAGAGIVGAAVVLGTNLVERPTLSRLIHKLPLGHIIDKVRAAVYSYRFHPRRILEALVFSFIAHASVIIGLYFLGRALGITGIPLPTYFFLIPLGLCVNAIPISPGGLGTAEVAFGKLFEMANPACTLGAELCMLFHLFLILRGQIGLVFYIFHKKKYGTAESIDKTDDAA